MSNLASDLNNPEFVNPTNPDNLLHVEFFYAEPVDKWASDQASYQQNKKVVIKLPKQPFVRIMKPGDKSSIIETAVREDHKRRWPEKWLYFQMSEGLVDDGANIPGWKVEEWPFLEGKTELLRELKFARFHTVEQIAGASDAQVQKMGIGGLGLREQARVDLRGKVGADVRAEIAAKDKEVTDLKSKVEEMMKMIQSLSQPIIQPEQSKEETQVTHENPVENVEVAVKKKGRPKGSKNKPKV